MRQRDAALALLGLGVVAGFLAVVALRRTRAPGPDVSVLRERIVGIDEGVEIHDLGDGFFELTGEVATRARADRIEQAISGVEGVVGVVNRLWIV
ncbi:MAG: BON domain-containing protein [Gemmatimonadota bacterium]